jgi:hypothetical protein
VVRPTPTLYGRRPVARNAGGNLWSIWNGPAPGLPFRAPMAFDSAISGSAEVYVYRGSAPADRPQDHYTPRVIPRHDGAFITLELPLIVWQK